MPKLLAPKVVAALLGVPESTLAQWRYRRVGPPYIKVEGHVRYPGDGVDAYLADNTVETGGAVSA